MGYDVHITRKQRWSDENGPEIPLSEWIAVVEADRDMRLDGYAETRVGDGSILRIENKGLSVWTAWSHHSENGMAWFSFRHGNVVVKNPDLEIRRKMWSLAQALSAKVQGDEGEFYDVSGNQQQMGPQLPIKKSAVAILVNRELRATLTAQLIELSSRQNSASTRALCPCC